MSQTVLGLDVGQKRIGVAVGDAAIGFANPLTTVINDKAIWDTIRELVTLNEATSIVVGRPRGLDGQETAQTREIAKFVAELGKHVTLPVHQVDEAVTSVLAEAELQARGKDYAKGDIDALAATFILQDYLDLQRSKTV